MPGVCATPLDVGAGVVALTEATSPARVVPESTHVSAIANAKRLILFVLLNGFKSCKPTCKEDRIEHQPDFLQGAGAVANILRGEAGLLTLTQRSLFQ